MPVDATGSVSAKLGIYKYNTGADAPSGKGLNNIVDDLDDIISRLGISGPVANDVPVYDSVAGKWKKASGTPSSSVFLRGDGSWAAPATGLTLICDSVLGAPGTVFDTNTILGGNIPQTFKHLKVILTGRGDAVVTHTGTSLRFNNDSGTNYAFQVVQGDTATPTAAFATANGGPVTDFLGASAPASQSSGSETNIFDYTNTTFFKNASGLGFGRYSATAGIEQAIGFSWSSTAAITRIQAVINTGNFLAGSRFTLYGLA